MPQALKKRILSMAEAHGVFMPKDILESNKASVAIRDLVAEGSLVRVGRGLYQRADFPMSEHISLAEVSRRLPGGVVCLLSALSFHELTTQNSPLVWLALAHKGPVKSGSPMVRVVRMSGRAFSAGIEVHLVDGVRVRIYSIAKTVADCFKFRNQVGIDVATEALQDAWRRRVVRMDDLLRESEACRVRNVMRPYLEMLR